MKMKLRKTLAAALAIAMALSMVGCSSSGTTTSSTTAATTTTESTTASSGSSSVTSSTGTAIADVFEAEEAGEIMYDEPLYTLKYCHMNTEQDDSGVTAEYFAERVFELTNGAVAVEIYPNSVVGSSQEMVEMVAAGTMDINHYTWGGISTLCTTVELLDTPYLVANVEDALKLFDMQDSPIMAEINELLIAESGVRAIGAGYGGSRMLTANFPVYSPDDLSGVKVRCIPSQVYMTAVEGMGAIAVAVDWADVPTALATGVADGQENPPGTIYNANIQESQSYIMETRHIIPVGPLIINENSLTSLPEEYQAAIIQAAEDRDEAFAALSIQNEEVYLQMLQDEGMTYITADDGLDVAAFQASVAAKVAEDFPQYADWYAKINDYLGYT